MSFQDPFSRTIDLRKFDTPKDAPNYNDGSTTSPGKYCGCTPCVLAYKERRDQQREEKQNHGKTI